MITLSLPWWVPVIAGALSAAGLRDLACTLAFGAKRYHARRNYRDRLRSIRKQHREPGRAVLNAMLALPGARLREQVIPITSASGHHCTIRLHTNDDDRQAHVVTCDHETCASWFSVGSLGQAHADSLASMHEADPAKYPLLNRKGRSA